MFQIPLKKWMNVIGNVLEFEWMLWAQSFIGEVVRYDFSSEFLRKSIKKIGRKIGIFLINDKRNGIALLEPIKNYFLPVYNELFHYKDGRSQPPHLELFNFFSTLFFDREHVVRKRS